MKTCRLGDRAPPGDVRALLRRRRRAWTACWRDLGKPHHELRDLPLRRLLLSDSSTSRSDTSRHGRDGDRSARRSGGRWAIRCSVLSEDRAEGEWWQPDLGGLHPELGQRFPVGSTAPVGAVPGVSSTSDATPRFSCAPICSLRIAMVRCDPRPAARINP